ARRAPASARQELTLKNPTAPGAGYEAEVRAGRRLYHRRMLLLARALALLAALAVGGCGGDPNLKLRGGQTEAKLAQDRTEGTTFVQPHPGTSTQRAARATPT